MWSSEASAAPTLCHGVILTPCCSLMKLRCSSAWLSPSLCLHLISPRTHNLQFSLLLKFHFLHIPQMFWLFFHASSHQREDERCLWPTLVIPQDVWKIVFETSHGNNVVVLCLLSPNRATGAHSELTTLRDSRRKPDVVINTFLCGAFLTDSTQTLSGCRGSSHTISYQESASSFSFLQDLMDMLSCPLHHVLRVLTPGTQL